MKTFRQFLAEETVRSRVTLVEAAHPWLPLVQQYRAWMERDGWLDSRAGGRYGSSPRYRGTADCFGGMCELHATELARRLDAAGYEVRVVQGEYHTPDPKFLDDPSDTWHYWIEVDGMIVDVTADQFHPSDPKGHRIVVVPVGDTRYQERAA